VRNAEKAMGAGTMDTVATTADDDVLSPSAWSRVLTEWAARAGVDAKTFRSAGIHAVQREDLAALVVVRIRSSTVVVAPYTGLAAIAGLQAHELLSEPTLMERLARCDPEFIGTASIGFREHPFGGSHEHHVEPAHEAAVEELRAANPEAEWHEGGLGDMPNRWAVHAPSGQVAAIAGFEQWGEGLAQIGVVAHPTFRGRGYARDVASHAITEAHNAGLVSQWRARGGNETSQRLGASLGFAVLGQQAAVALRNPHP